MRNPERVATRDSRILGRVPFRRKIDMLVVLPTMALAGLLTPVAVHEVDSARVWSDSAAYLQSTKPISLLIEDLSVERDRAQTALAIAALPVTVDAIDKYQAAVAVTNRQVLEARKSLSPSSPPSAAAALASVAELSYVRSQTPQSRHHPDQGSVAVLQDLVNTNYGRVVENLVDAMDLSGRTALGGPAVRIEAELAALYNSDLAESQRESALAAFANTTNADNALLDYTTAVQSSQVAADEIEDFKRYASPEDLDALTFVTPSDQTRAFDHYQVAIGKALSNDLGLQHGPAESLAVGQLLESLRSGMEPTDITQNFVILSDRRARMESTVTDGLVALAQRNARTATLTVYGLLGVVVGTFLLLVALSVTIRHSVVRPVLRLTRAATRVAQAAAEDLERVADEDPGQRAPIPEFDPLPVPTGDELGELAVAFNQVQETALLVLERQITIRRNTAEMFGNVGRRIHNLTDRQLSLIDQVERTETDPDLLDRMYRIDHLAVRLQRGADSLVLLSGEREPEVGGGPMRLTDVVRSAVGRVEGYQRAVLIAEDDAMVVPASVSDLTLMVAELVDNAVSFSPATARVEIAVGLTQRGFAVEIVDRGMGMTPEDMARENSRLIRRERLDLAPTRVLGLFVVGRLAQRTGAAVELAPTAGGGTTARIFVPGFLLAGTPQDDQRQRGPGAPTREPFEPFAPFGSAEASESAQPTPPMPPIGSQPTGMPGSEPLRRRALGSGVNGSPPLPQPYSPPSSDAFTTPFPSAQNPSVPTPAHFTPVPEPRQDTDALPKRRRKPPVGEPPLLDATPVQAVPPFPTAEAFPTRETYPTQETFPSQESFPVSDGFPPLEQPPAPGQDQTTNLPRRVRNTAPRPEWPTADHLTPAAPAPHLDAVAVRSALEEYEAGVEQALRDSSDDLPTRRRSGARHAGDAPARDGEHREKGTKP